MGDAEQCASDGLHLLRKGREGVVSNKWEAGDSACDQRFHKLLPGMVREGNERSGKELQNYTKSPAEDGTLPRVVSRWKTMQILARMGRRRDSLGPAF